MEKVAEFINAKSYRQALARLCRLANESRPDYRLILGDWENLYLKHKKKWGVLYVIRRFENEDNAIKPDEITENPLLWLKALDEHCQKRLGPDASCPYDKIDDGTDESVILPINPSRGGGAQKNQFCNISYWLKYHRVIPLSRRVDVKEIPPGYKDWIAQQMPDDVNIRIAVAHFADDVTPDISRVTSELFVCKDISNREKRLAEMLRHIRNAKSAGAHILVVPELTITPAIRLQIANELERLHEEDGENHALAVPVIILGSFHEQIENKWQNYAKAVLGLNGTDLFECYKRTPVTINNCKEYIEYSSTPLTCLFTPIGLMAMIICKDLFDGVSADVLATLPLDWLLVPSMSNKLGPHKEAAKKLHDRKGTVVAVANQEMPKIEDCEPGVNQETSRTDDYEPSFVHHEQYEECTSDLHIVALIRKDSYLKLIK